jgi:sugar phosphate permease
MFYGWYILGVSMLGALLSAGTSQLYFSIMLKPITDEFGWGRTALSGVVTLGTVGIIAITPFLGRMADRYGARLLMTGGLLVTAVTYLLMPLLTELWQFFVVFGIGRAVAGPALFGVAPTAALANWFRRKRGRVLGLLAMSIWLGNGVLVLLGQLLIDTSGWRTSWLAIGVATLALAVPTAAIIRHRPEEMGLLPDGEATAAREAVRSPARSTDEASWSLSEAMRTPALWLIAAAGCLAGTAVSGVSFHQVAYFTDMGIPPLAAVVSLATFAMSGAAASVLWGYLAERFPERQVVIVTLLLAAGVNLLLLTIRTLPGALVFAVLFGLTSRGDPTLLNLILVRYFGRRSFGSISGFVQPFLMVGLAVGPLLASVVFDLTGSYQGVFLGYAGLWLLGAVCLWLARRPRRPSRQAGGDMGRQREPGRA